MFVFFVLRTVPSTLHVLCLSKGINKDQIKKEVDAMAASQCCVAFLLVDPMVVDW